MTDPYEALGSASQLASKSCCSTEYWEVLRDRCLCLWISERVKNSFTPHARRPFTALRHTTTTRTAQNIIARGTESVTHSATSLGVSWMVLLMPSARFECWSVVQIELQDCNSRPAVRWPAEGITLQSYERLIWPIPKNIDSRAEILQRQS